ncbi:MAG: acetyl-CoA carboxylase biotin carboxyl carrier protein [Gammaproteobacteria bacterium]|nr:acetyl-CoA carboxylase biotin carboxyl carrier protein [Gammaproteobacteria bacterium]MYD77292.1 acetyl-CoA carboxylase biotin carboxyl carrier protein [Gammaproteobacteria bacterium]MYJ52568.1 acetyl-CoA carboxylase biotin carboxyl carrier protein [Gammaproteobacteria bacterium]
MDLRKVKKLIELLESSKLTEIEITEGDSTIRLSRTTGPDHPVLPAVQPHATATSPLSLDASPGEDETGGITVPSPMVGTFYPSSEPGADPYVTVGSEVKPGDTLCILEAMKTFNHVKSEISGTVRTVMKSSGDPVEYGEPLFLIDPS